MARTPKYGIATKPLSLRPRPVNDEAIQELVKHTGVTRAEIADEALTLGLPKLLRKHRLPIPTSNAREAKAMA
jgi:hypothetical protein